MFLKTCQYTGLYEPLYHSDTSINYVRLQMTLVWNALMHRYKHCCPCILVEKRVNFGIEQNPSTNSSHIGSNLHPLPEQQKNYLVLTFKLRFMYLFKYM